MENFKVSKSSHPELVSIMLTAFPDYRGRKFEVRIGESFRLADYWSGGTRFYSAFVKIAPTDGANVVTGDELPRELMQQRGNPFGLTIGRGELIPGIALVEHIFFCGKDHGLRLQLHPDNAVKALPTFR